MARIKAKTPKAKEKSAVIFLRVKESRYKLLQECLADMVAKNPLLDSGGFSEIDLVRSLVDRFLVEQGKLKKDDLLTK